MLELESRVPSMKKAAAAAIAAANAAAIAAAATSSGPPPGTADSSLQASSSSGQVLDPSTSLQSAVASTTGHSVSFAGPELAQTHAARKQLRSSSSRGSMGSVGEWQDAVLGSRWCSVLDFRWY
jgi:hypothetical protein